MQSVKFEPLSSGARVACAAIALVFCLASVSFVVLSFASVSGESNPPPARMKPYPAGAVAIKQPRAKPVPG